MVSTNVRDHGHQGDGDGREGNRHVGSAAVDDGLVCSLRLPRLQPRHTEQHRQRGQEVPRRDPEPRGDTRHGEASSRWPFERAKTRPDGQEREEQRDAVGPRDPAVLHRKWDDRPHRGGQEANEVAEHPSPDYEQEREYREAEQHRPQASEQVEAPRIGLEALGNRRRRTGQRRTVEHDLPEPEGDCERIDHRRAGMPEPVGVRVAAGRDIGGRRDEVALVDVGDREVTRQAPEVRAERQDHDRGHPRDTGAGRPTGTDRRRRSLDRSATPPEGPAKPNPQAGELPERPG